MQHFAVIGQSLPHTYSPAIHGRAIKLLDLDASYTTIEIPPMRFAEQIIDIKNSGKYSGFNVTIPYKTHIFSVLDQVDTEAEAIGAVNTINVVESTWHGYNTDVYGFLNPLGSLNQKFRNCLILGAGGAARAVIYALAKQLITLTITLCARNVEKAALLVSELKPQTGQTTIDIQSMDFAAEHYPDFDLIVNSTPLGMFPHVHSSPIQLNKKTDRPILFYDLVYNPQKTRFLSEARKMCSQAIVIGGLDMLISQAAKSFEIWTKLKFPVADVQNFMQSVLS
jgi:shikimate dehydrogenase